MTAEAGGITEEAGEAMAVSGAGKVATVAGPEALEVGGGLTGGFRFFLLTVHCFIPGIATKETELVARKATKALTEYTR